MKNMLKNRLFLGVLSAIMLIGIMVGCQAKDDNNEENDTENNTQNEVEETPVTDPNALFFDTNTIDHEETDAIPEVTIEMENGGEILVELYPNIAPNAVNNFLALASDGFYDGVIFHRVIPGFMIQGGDPDGTGMGGPGYNIPGEFANGGFDNDLKHERGVLSMARSGHPDSAGSQFFIMTDDSPHLDKDYAGFGKAIDGLDIIDEIVGTETGAQDKPVEDQVIKKMTVELNGYEPKDPVKTNE